MLTESSDADLRAYAEDMLAMVDAMAAQYGEGVRFFSEIQGYVGTVPEATLQGWLADWRPAMIELDGVRKDRRRRAAERQRSLAPLLAARYGREFALTPEPRPE